MLKNIKCIFFTRFIFYYLEEEKKLELVKYNKNLKNLLDISLLNYKVFKGKHIIFGKRGKVKEYDNYSPKKVFEGEYLNGKRNGKGKEYKDYNILSYEGNFKDGKRNGKGKEFIWHDDNIYYTKFEGEYLNGKKWNGRGFDGYQNQVYELKNGKGYIKDYYYKDVLKFEGDYLNGERNGKGKEYHWNHSITFEGKYLNGKRNGEGKEYFFNGIIQFEGEYLNGKRWIGKGYNPDGIKIFELKNGKGLIKEFYGDGSIKYEGEYLNGERNGNGKEYYQYSKLMYEGEFKNGQKQGKGKEYYENNLIFEGEYLYDHKVKGRGFVKSKLEYEGEYLYDKKWNGKGYDEKRNIIYKLINGNGKVKEYNENGELIFEGEYLNGKENGWGKRYYSGELVEEGKYENGKFKDPMIQILKLMMMFVNILSMCCLSFFVLEYLGNNYLIKN